MVLPPFYTPCYIMVKSRSLSQAWLALGALCIIVGFAQIFGEHSCKFSNHNSR
eukprot:SAG11_NODE_17939_length_504_cov_6.118519_1_plen_52_part_01